MMFKFSLQPISFAQRVFIFLASRYSAPYPSLAPELPVPTPTRTIALNPPTPTTTYLNYPCPTPSLRLFLGPLGISTALLFAAVTITIILCILFHFSQLAFQRLSKNPAKGISTESGLLGPAGSHFRRGRAQIWRTDSPGDNPEIQNSDTTPPTHTSPPSTLHYNPADPSTRPGSHATTTPNRENNTVIPTDSQGTNTIIANYIYEVTSLKANIERYKSLIAQWKEKYAQFIAERHELQQKCAYVETKWKARCEQQKSRGKIFMLQYQQYLQELSLPSYTEAREPGEFDNWSAIANAVLASSAPSGNTPPSESMNTPPTHTSDPASTPHPNSAGPSNSSNNPPASSITSNTLFESMILPDVRLPNLSETDTSASTSTARPSFQATTTPNRGDSTVIGTDSRAPLKLSWDHMSGTNTIIANYIYEIAQLKADIEHYKSVITQWNRKYAQLIVERDELQQKCANLKMKWKARYEQQKLETKSVALQVRELRRECTLPSYAEAQEPGEFGDWSAIINAALASTPPNSQNETTETSADQGVPPSYDQTEADPVAPSNDQNEHDRISIGLEAPSDREHNQPQNELEIVRDHHQYERNGVESRAVLLNYLRDERRRAPSGAVETPSRHYLQSEPVGASSGAAETPYANPLQSEPDRGTSGAGGIPNRSYSSNERNSVILSDLLD
ncbi:hypothetical protein C0995_001314 [Termitomyces sp. Mi166|nr:hypothetical protein C0995_001314 [Termitomyces sp. Mi166\